MISGALALQVVRGGSPSSLPPSVSLSLAQGETASYIRKVTTGAYYGIVLAACAPSGIVRMRWMPGRF